MASILPWRNRDKEGPRPSPVEDRNYSDIVTQALVNAATDNLVDAYVSALEIASGQLSRAFSAAAVDGPGAAAFGPWTMSQIGRQLVEQGEAVWYRVGMELRRADNYEITPRGAYQLSLPGGVRIEPGDRVFHARWNVDTASGRGLSPLGAARTLRLLMQRLENSLATENNAIVGYLLPVPADGDAANISQLKDDLAGLNGRVAVIETARAAWGEGTSAAPRRDFELARMGPNIPEGNVRLFIAARESVLAACGYPVQLAQDSDGTSQREAWRRYLHGTVAPLGRMVTAEAARVGLPVSLDWDTLFASDIQGRARAFQSLVGGGMDIAQAAAASGLLQPED
ncbi:MAG: hypothetical protein F4Z31_04430 [Gemmatimonadetes bacterium]|nr:hypothetical protein [Gemmatimonadota bacterium]MYJ10493.1 hypothetical protein [Gemmatimonadota bacterium]